MSKQVRLQQMYNVMEEMLNSGGTVNFNPRGYSMCPTLRNDGDRVVIKKISSLKKYDLPLYIRPDGSFVLHRVVSVNKDGTYNICGDNQWDIEHNVKHSQVVGVVTTIERKGKRFSVNNPLYKIYVVFWVAIRPLRHILFGGIRKLKKAIMRSIGKKNI